MIKSIRARLTPVVLTSCLLLAATAAHSQNRARSDAATRPDKKSGALQKITTAMVTITSGESRVKCYLARPSSGKPAPGLIVIHEWWGLNDWVKKQTDRFARQGYAALAVDLYHGEVAKDAEHAHELMRGLPDERAVDDLQAAFKYLDAPRVSQGKPIGVVGWCMGGGYALKLAIVEPKLACTVMCYGRPVTDVEQLHKIKGPLLGVWGANDRGIDVPPFKQALEKAGVKATHHVYPGAGHAFLNETNKRGYNKEQAEKAWSEIDAFLKRHLAGAETSGRLEKAGDQE